MGYFGGLGAGRGWHSLHLLITPEELKGVLAAELRLVVTNRRVEVGYRQTGVEEYLQRYRSFVDHITHGGPVPWQASSPLYVSLVRPQTPLSERPVTDGEEQFKLLSPEEPAIGARPFELHFHLDRLSPNLGNPQDPAYFGLEMGYPRVVFFKREGYAVERDASTYPNADLFAALAEQIRALTRPCRIESPKQVHRTRIRISPRMRELMLDNPFFAARGLRVV